jgi:hypothetical protein
MRNCPSFKSGSERMHRILKQKIANGVLCSQKISLQLVKGLHVLREKHPELLSLLTCNKNESPLEN